jgi:hypothetical protein
MLYARVFTAGSYATVMARADAVKGAAAEQAGQL